MNHDVSIHIRVQGMEYYSYANLKYVEKLTGLSQPELYSSFRIRAALPVKDVPECEKWRLGLLTNLFKLKNERFLRVEDSKSICAMLDSLCST